MKMISSTNITSASGMMLISAIGPPPGSVLKAMSRSLSLAGSVFLQRDEADLAHALALRDQDDVIHHAVLGGLVTADVDARLRHLLRLDRQPALEQLAADRLVVPVEAAFLGDRDGHRRNRRCFVL